MDNRRTDSAREHDDSDLIDSIETAPSHGGSSGGTLQEDVATEAELERVRDPEAREGASKQHKIDHQEEIASRRPADSSG